VFATRLPFDAPKSSRKKLLTAWGTNVPRVRPQLFEPAADENRERFGFSCLFVMFSMDGFRMLPLQSGRFRSLTMRGEWAHLSEFERAWLDVVRGRDPVLC
jgi:hypothetical protein